MMPATADSVNPFTTATTAVAQLLNAASAILQIPSGEEAHPSWMPQVSRRQQDNTNLQQPTLPTPTFPAATISNDSTSLEAFSFKVLTHLDDSIQLVKGCYENENFRQLLRNLHKYSRPATIIILGHYAAVSFGISYVSGIIIGRYAEPLTQKITGDDLWSTGLSPELVKVAAVVGLIWQTSTIITIGFVLGLTNRHISKEQIQRCFGYVTSLFKARTPPSAPSPHQD